MEDDSRDEDGLVVSVPDAIATASLAAVVFPLAIKPTERGAEAALSLVGGIEKLTRVTNDEVLS